MFMVPFDGSPLAEAALAKAKLNAIALGESRAAVVDLLFPDRGGDVTVVAVCVVPDSRSYAERKGWVEEDEVFSRRTVVERLHRQAAALAPSADFRVERIDAVATGGTIAAHLRRQAESAGATDVVMGGQPHEASAASLGSVTRGMVSGGDYDVTIVRRPLPRRVERRIKSDFYLPE